MTKKKPKRAGEIRVKEAKTRMKMMTKKEKEKMEIKREIKKEIERETKMKIEREIKKEIERNPKDQKNLKKKMMLCQQECQMTALKKMKKSKI